MSDTIAASAEQPMVDMKTHILTVASKLILEKGIKNMSLKDIAKTAGISKGTLYYYYSAKEDIIYDIARRNMDQITQEILSWIQQKNGGLPLEEQLYALFQKMLSAEASGKLHLHLLNDAVAANDKLAEQFRTLYEDWRRMLTEALEKAYPETGSQTNAKACLILAIMDGLMIQKICGAQDLPLREIIGLLLH